MDGVSKSLVRAISSGAKTMPAIPDADTEARTESRGDGDERMSKRARLEGDGKDEIVELGSGRAKMAQRKDRRKEAIVENKTPCQNVLFVPFHTPHAPSFAHRLERTAVMEDVEGRAFV